MDQILSFIDQLNQELTIVTSTKPKNLKEALERESSIMYMRYCLEVCEQKLTNTLDKRTIEKITALKTNFIMCKDKDFVFNEKDEEEMVKEIYNDNH